MTDTSPPQEWEKEFEFKFRYGGCNDQTRNNIKTFIAAQITKARIEGAAEEREAIIKAIGLETICHGDPRWKSESHLDVRDVRLENRGAAQQRWIILEAIIGRRDHDK